jgi:phenylalanyl-tRNA synthetase beta chain
MIITRNWLNEWIDLSDKTSEELCDTLNSIGLEVDSLKKIEIPKKVVVGFVKECKKHPDADKLSVCQVDIGKESLQIVCGAKNVKADQYVPVAITGAVLGDNFKIKKAKLRGIESNGMICSSTEIGLPEINNGIMELDDSIGKLETGKELCEYKLINDDIIEIELTANRGDCLSVFGIARDLGAAYGREVCYVEDLKDEDGTLGIGRVLSISSKEGSYSSLLYKVFQQEETVEPLLLKLRNAMVDKKSDNAYDLYKNYINHSTGVIIKLYSFDLCEKDGKCKLELKKDKNGIEFIQIGDKVSYVGFDEKDDLKPAGDNKSVIFEASYAHPDIISKAGKYIDNKQDKIFYHSSRGSEPNLEFGAKLFKIILSKYSKVKWYSGFEIIDNRPEPKVINIYISKINALIGQEVEKGTVVSILKNLGFKVEMKDEFDLMSVEIPLFRHDISNEEDITEEIVRIIGIDNISSSPLEFIESNNQNKALLNYKKRVYFRQKAASSGFFEITNYIFTDSNKLEKLGFDKTTKAKELLNPVTKELNTLRSTLAVGLLESVERNYKYGKKSIRLFEVGTVFDKERNESTKISFIFSGETERAAIRNGGKPKIIDFFTFAQKISSIIGEFDIENDKDAKSYLSPFESGKIVKNTQVLGYIGRVHLDIENEYDLPKTYICEIDFDKLNLEKKTVRAYSKYPSVERDFSFIIPKDMPYIDLKKIISSDLPKEVVKFYPIDRYESSDLGENISLTVRFILQSFDKTLNDDDINAIIFPILDKLESSGIKLR